MTSPDFVFIVMMFKTVICSVVLLVSRKRMTTNETKKIPIKPIILIVLFTAVSEGLTYMLQLIGATTLPATVLYPFVTGGSEILTAFAGVLVFKEKLSVRQFAGIAICFVGTVILL